MGVHRTRRAPPVAGAALAVSAVLTATSLAIALRRPDTTLRNGWFDVLAEPTLPTWWSTALLLGAGAAHGLAGVLARRAGRPAAGAWFVGAAAAIAFSLSEHSGLHDRLDGVGRQLLGAGPLTDTWLVLGAAVAVPVAAVLVAAAGRVDAPSRRPFAAGATLLLSCAVGGEFVAGLLPARAAVTAGHLGELGENVGAVLLLVAAGRAISVTTAGGALRIAHPVHPLPDGPPLRVPWRLLVGTCAALSALSLVFVLNAAVLEPTFREWRLYVDVLVEHNLPSWFSSAMLLAAATAHALAARTARLAGAPAAAAWTVTAAALALLSLDDHTQLHERSEGLGRLVVTERGDFPFYWLLPGAAAGLVLATAVAVLALRVPRPARRALAGGVAVLLGCALGLEVVQGLFMAAGNEGTGFALGYHVEELGENVAALLFLAAAAGTLRVGPADGALAVRYIAAGGDRALIGSRSRVTQK